VRINQEVLRDRQESGSEGKRDAGILGIDCFIHPDVEASRAVLRSLSHGALGNIFNFAGTSYELGSVNIAEGSALDGLPMSDYRSIVKEDSLIALVERQDGSVWEQILPKGPTVLTKGDRIHILAPEARMEHIFRLAGSSERPLRHIGIVGGGRIGMLIAEGILRYHGTGKEQDEMRKADFFSRFRSVIPANSRRVVIIEQDYMLCKDLAARLPEALVLNEDISDESFISEERLDSLDLIITATANQELNIVAAVYLKSRGVGRAIALVMSSGYEAIARQLGVDVVIPMQTVLTDSILSNLMGQGIRGVHQLGDGTLRIIEAEIGDNSPAIEKAITEFRPSAGGLIMLVHRGDVSFIPRGDYIFKAGDRIVLIVKSGSEAELDKFFGIQGKA
jgi:trk system potassium uptake protein TrkA